MKERNLGFHIPGHHQGQGVPSGLKQLITEFGFSADITEVSDLDDIHNPHNQCLHAQKLAAAAYGSDETFFLINGSTVGNQAMFLATLGPEDTVLMPYSSHRSAFSALILSGAKACLFSTMIHPELLCALPPTLKEVQRALEHCSHAKALFLTSPNYHGAVAELAEIKSELDKRGILLLVDEAWGGHLRFSEELPNSAVQIRADLVVQSSHKMTPALTQTALLHRCGQRVDTHRIKSTLSHLQTSSPSSLLVASIDIARRQMALHGQKLIHQALEFAEIASRRINALPGVSCFTWSGRTAWDKTRLIVNTLERGYSGHQLALHLRKKHAIQVEMSEAHQVLLVAFPDHTQGDLEHLLFALSELNNGDTNLNIAELRKSSQNLKAREPLFIDLRHIFQSASETCNLENAIGRVSAELLYLSLIHI